MMVDKAQSTDAVQLCGPDVVAALVHAVNPEGHPACLDQQPPGN